MASQIGDTRGGKRTWLFRVAAVVSSLLVAWCGGELFTRALHGSRHAERPAFLEPDSRLGWRPASFLRHDFYGPDFRIEIVTDSAGYRLGRLGDWSTGAPLIIASGDSYTFGWGVSSADTYPSLLDDRVSAAGAATPMRVVNLGVGGYGTTQSALRLADFTAREHRPPIRAAILLHSHNDFVDNIQFLVMREGFTRPVQISPNGSPSHLANWIRRSALHWRDPETSVGDDHVRKPDILLNTRLKRIEQPSREIRVRSLVVQSEDLFLEREHQAPTLERASLTPLQTALLVESLQFFHAALAAEETLILHAVIHSAPDWYVDTVARAVSAARTSGQRVVFVGRVPARRDFEGTFANRHSGHHFTPELNRYYAETFARWLREIDGAEGE